MVGLQKTNGSQKNEYIENRKNRKKAGLLTKEYAKKLSKIRQKSSSTKNRKRGRKERIKCGKKRREK